MGRRRRTGRRRVRKSGRSQLMHKPVLILAAVLVLLVSLPLRAEEAKSASAEVDAAALEVRATQAVNAKEWSTALPLLKKVAEKLKDQPDRLGQIEEQIRVCERN